MQFVPLVETIAANNAGIVRELCLESSRSKRSGSRDEIHRADILS
jgi:hypothetical protein